MRTVMKGMGGNILIPRRLVRVSFRASFFYYGRVGR